MREERIHRLLVAVDDIEDAIGQPRPLQQLRQEESGRRIALRRLEHEGVAAHQGDGEHPQRHHGGEVERCDTGNDSQGLAQREGVDVRADVLGDLPLEQMRPPAGELHHLDPSPHLAHGIRMHLAMLHGDDAGELIGMLVQQRLEAAHDPGTAQGRRGGPGREGTLRRGDGLGHLGFIGQGQACRHLAGRRIVHIVKAIPLAGEPFAVNKVMQGIIHIHLEVVFRSQKAPRKLA